MPAGSIIVSFSILQNILNYPSYCSLPELWNKKGRLIWRNLYRWVKIRLGDETDTLRRIICLERSGKG
jgi:hypothetical protein